jgi:bacteriorhodopsin
MSETIQPLNNIPKISSGIKFSFTITYILLLTTATITFIEAIRTKNPVVRHVLNLETCISIVAGYFYSAFIAKIDIYEKASSDSSDSLVEDGIRGFSKETPMEFRRQNTKRSEPSHPEPKNRKVTENFWKEIIETRYIDWSITTPLMLLALCVVLSSEIKQVVHLPIMLLIVILNYVMLYAGYLGETKILDRTTANIAGFLPFFAMFGLIYWKYVAPKYNLANRTLFYFYLVVWSLYGIVYLFDDEIKNIAMNILDLFAKCLIGLGLWVYYVRIIRL